MSEFVKPDIVLPLTKKWFVEIWNGNKRVEYRSVKPYWDKRIGKWLSDVKPRFVMFQIGYAKDGLRILAQTTKIDIGECPYLGWEGLFYRISFIVVKAFHLSNGIYFPLLEMAKMRSVNK